MIHLLDRGLDRLVVLADLGSSSGQRAIWFDGCVLKGSVLFVPDAEMAGFIGRCFLEQLRRVRTDLEIRVGQPDREQAKPVKPKRELWKTGKAPEQRDML